MISHRPLRWFFPGMLLAGLTCCAHSDSAQGLEAGTPTGRVNVYVIAREDHGVKGRAAGCGDSAVALGVDLPAPAPALEGALAALLGLQEGADAKGLYNALAHSPLKVDRIDRSGAEVRVYLSGYLEIGDECDGARILAQLTETVLQFHDVQHAQFFVDGKPLPAVLAGRG
ncbi:MAG TPA: GerMN domain-containing protein [Thermoanaerobaculia bacterium]|nr:GerMN domain-containing protein [Thermoanaerobaculia bacterium]